jgi:hypothetical protein
MNLDPEPTGFNLKKYSLKLKMIVMKFQKKIITKLDDSIKI